MILDKETLKRDLRFWGGQYTNEVIARGTSDSDPPEPHMLTQAVDRIESLEDALEHLLEIGDGLLPEGDVLMNVRLVLDQVLIYRNIR